MIDLNYIIAIINKKTKSMTLKNAINEAFDIKKIISMPLGNKILILQ